MQITHQLGYLSPSTPGGGKDSPGTNKDGPKCRRKVAGGEVRSL